MFTLKKDGILKKFNRLVSGLLAAVLMMQIVPSDVFAQGEAREVTPPTFTTSVEVTESVGVTKLDSGYYMLEQGANLRLKVSVSSQNLSTNSFIGGLYSTVQLGYFDSDGSIVDTDKGYGGVHAKVVSDSTEEGFWQDSELLEQNPDSPTYTDPNKEFKGSVRLDARPGKQVEPGKTYTYEVLLYFDSKTAENAIITVNTRVGYYSWSYQENNQWNDVVVNYISDLRQESQVVLINSNLKWEYSAVPYSGEYNNSEAPVLWQEYNYQDVLLTIRNVSERDTAYFDAFEFLFKLQYELDINGIQNVQLLQWLYNEDDPSNPTLNPNPATAEKDRFYTGVPRKGGILIYDVTDLSSEDYYDEEKLGTPLPYTYTSNGMGTVKLTKELGGTVVTDNVAAQDPNARSEVVLLMRIPFPNAFEFGENTHVNVNDYFTPTVFFGTPEVSISKDPTQVLQWFQKPETSGAVNKEAQADPMYIGEKAYYTISGIVNTSNLPVFSPYLIDTLPAYFDLTEFEYIISSAEYEEPIESIDINSVLSAESPIQAEFESQLTGEKVWVSLGTLYEGQSEDPEQRLWRLEGADKAIESYLEAHPSATFTRRIRVNYAYEFDKYIEENVKLDKGETIPGTLKIIGIPEKSITLTNNAEVYFGYNYYRDPIYGDSGWVSYPVGPYTDNASKPVTPADLWLQAQGLYDDGLNRTEGNPTTGTINSEMNGYTIRFGIENKSKLTPGKLTAEIPCFTQYNADFYGFESRQILIKKELLDYIDIDTLTITLYSRNKVEFTYADLLNYVDEDGNIVLGLEDLYDPDDLENEELSEEDLYYRNLPVKLELEMKQVASDTPRPENLNESQAYIQILGLYKYPGTLNMDVQFESVYKDGLQKEIVVNSTGELFFDQPDLRIDTTSFYTLPGEDIVEVERAEGELEYPYAGYRARPYTYETALAPGFVQMKLPGGFVSDKVTITKDLISNTGNIENEPTYTGLTFVSTKGTSVTYTPEQIEQFFVTGEGSIVVEKSQWESAPGWSGDLSYVRFNFSNYRIDTYDVNYDTAYIEVTGSLGRNGDNVATGTFSSNYYLVAGMDQAVVSDTANIYVPLPEMSITVNAIISDPVGGTPPEADTVTGDLRFDYSGYKIYPQTQDVSVIPGYLQVDMPSYYITDEIFVSDSFLAAINNQYTQLVIIDDSKNAQGVEEGKSFVFGFDELKYYVAADGTISSELWENAEGWTDGNSVRTIKLYFDIFRHTDKPEDCYVEVRGKVSNLGDNIATGTLSTDYDFIALDKNQYKVSDTANINVKTPIITVKTDSLLYDQSLSLLEIDPDKVTTELDYKYSGYRVKAKTEDSSIVPGYMSLSMPSYYDTHGVKITSELFDNTQQSYTKVVISGTNGASITLTKEQMQDYLVDGDFVLSKTQYESMQGWKEDSFLTGIVLYFDRFNMGTPSNYDDAYIEVYGIANVIGNNVATGGMSTDYDFFKYGQDQIVATDKANVVVTRPQLSIKADAYLTQGDAVVEGDPVTTSLNYEFSGYRVRVKTENSVLFPGFIQLDLPNKYESEFVFISKDMLDDMEQSYTSLTIRYGSYGSGGASVVLDKAQLDTYKDDDGNIVIPADVWKTAGTWSDNYQLLSVKLNFDKLTKHDSEAHGTGYDPNAFIGIQGVATINGSNILTASIHSDYKYTAVQDSASDTAEIIVTKPSIQVNTTAVYDDGSEFIESDPVKGVINKEFSGYRLRVNVENAVVAPGYVWFNLPKEFNASDILITSEFLSNLELGGSPSYTTFVITGTNGTEIVFDKDQIDGFINADGDFVLTQEDWMPDDWSETGEQILSAGLYFDYHKYGDDQYSQNIADLTNNNAYFEIRGTVTRVGDIIASGSLSTNYPAGSGNAQIADTDMATIRVPLPKLSINVLGLSIDQGVRQEEDTANAMIGQLEAGYTVRIASSNEARIEPGELTISLPANSVAANYYNATKIRITKEMLGNMKMTSLVITSLTGQKTEYTAEDLGLVWAPAPGSDYTVFDEDVIIDNTNGEAWEGIASSITIKFDYYKENTSADAADPAFMEILGTPYVDGTLTATGTLSTTYEIIESDVEGGQPDNPNISASDRGHLLVESIAPNVEVYSNNEIVSEDTLRPVTEQLLQETITVPVDWDTYYSYFFGNSAPNAAIAESEAVLTFNNRKRLPSDEVHGYDIEKVLIMARYESAFRSNGGVDAITVYDISGEISVKIPKKEFKTDAAGNLYVDIAQWQDTIDYIGSIKLEFSNFKNNVSGDDRLKVRVYGRTDWFTYMKDDNIANKYNGNWEKLKTDALFTSVNLIKNKSDKDDAYQNVPIPQVKMSIDYANYYEYIQDYVNPGGLTLEQMKAGDILGRVDNNIMRQETPYERDITYIFSLYQDSISESGIFTTYGDLPLNSSTEREEANRGFHAQQMLLMPEVFNGTHFDSFKMTLSDADKSENTIVIYYNGTNMILVDTNGTETTLTPEADGSIILTDDMWIAAGLKNLAHFRIDGDNFNTRAKTYDIFITGFSDSNFIDDERRNGGHTDIAKATADNFLRDIDLTDANGKYPYRIRYVDYGYHVVSKMFFDYQLETGFITHTDKDARYIQTGISSEHIRTGYPTRGYPTNISNVPKNYSNFVDIDHYAAGYKGLVSITADFRQYLYDNSNIKDLTMPINVPNGHSIHPHSSNWDYYIEGDGDYYERVDAPFIQKYAYNTAADLELTINIPEDDGLEAYYLKIDPRAVVGENGQKFINKIAVYRADGSVQEIDGSLLTQNSAKWDDETKQMTWYRLNLLTKNPDEYFITEDEYRQVLKNTAYYSLPSENMGERISPAQKVVIYVSMNQQASFNGVNAAMPDFGSWVEDTIDMDDQHMFEVVCRANEIMPLRYDKEDYIMPTATAKVIIGGREVDSTRATTDLRSTDGAVDHAEFDENGYVTENKRSDWSFNTYYAHYDYEIERIVNNRYYFRYFWIYSEYTAGHLFSSSRIFINEETKLIGDQGIEADFTLSSKDDYVYGREKVYNLTVFRANEYNTSIPANFLSYIDRADVNVAFPPIQGNFDDGYLGFRPTKLLIRTDLFERTDEIKLTFSDDSTRSYAKSDLDPSTIITSDNGVQYYVINIYYGDDTTHKPAIGAGLNPQDILLMDGANDKFITSADIVFEDIPGIVDIASDTYGIENDTWFNDRTKPMLRLYGNVNVNRDDLVNGTMDGVDRLTVTTINDGGEVRPHTHDATMRAFPMPLSAKSVLQYMGEGTLFDYQVTKNENGTDVGVQPVVHNYSLNFTNTGKQDQMPNGDTEPYDEAHIDTISFDQEMATGYRLTEVRVPKQLFEEGSKFRLTEFMVVDAEGEKDVLKYFTPEGDSYVLDISQLFADGVLTRVDGTYNGVNYSREHIYSIKGKYTATNTDITNIAGYLEAGDELLVGLNDLEFSGVYADRTLEDIENKVWDNNSTPSIGKNYYEFYSYQLFPKLDLNVTSPHNGTAPQKVESNQVGHNVYNRIAGLDVEIVRGSTVSVQGSDMGTVAYDDYYGKTDNTYTPVLHQGVPYPETYLGDDGWTEIGMYPGDRVEYTITVENQAEANIPLLNPEIVFQAPEGMRIIGWKFVSADVTDDVGTSEQISAIEDLYVSAYDENGNSQIFTEGTTYTNSDDGKYNYKTLVITHPDGENRYVGVGANFKVIVLTEMINDYEDSVFEGKYLDERIYVTAEGVHNYDSYYIFERNNNEGSDTRAFTDMAGTGKLVLTRKSVDPLNTGDGVNGVEADGNDLVYYKDNQPPSINIKFAEDLYRDYEDVQITVGNIKNYPKHYQDYMVLDINFVKETGAGAGKQYFYLTEMPEISYRVSDDQKDLEGVYTKDVEGETQYYRDAKLYYRTDKVVSIPESSADITDGWLELTQDVLDAQTDPTAFLESITAVRWIYEDVYPYLNNDAETVISLDNAVFNGYAEYQDERTDINTEINPYTSTMQINVNETYIHVHEEEINDEVLFVRENAGSAIIKRLRPNLEVNLQAFDSQEAAEQPYTAMPEDLKMGYRPSETFWYKLVVSNIQRQDYLGNGPLLKPIIYDKVPTQYLDFDGDYKILVINNADETEQDLTQKLKDAGAITSEKTQAADVGGSQYLSYFDTSYGDALPNDTETNPTYNPDDENSDTIEYTVYKIDFGKIDFDLDDGYRIEIIYDVTAHRDGLPLALWKDESGESGLDGENAYLPRYGEYTNNGDKQLTPGPEFSESDEQIGTAEKMMDMDNLIHEFGVTGDRNNATDPLEFLNNSTAYIPGAETNTKPGSDWDSGLTWNNVKADVGDKFFGSNIDSSSKQKVTIGMQNDDGYQSPSENTVYARYDNNASIYGTTFGGKLEFPRSYYTYLMDSRVSDTTDMAADQNAVYVDEQNQNIVWAQHNLHLQKSWIAGATETVNSDGGKYYEVGFDYTGMVIGNHSTHGKDASFETIPMNDQHYPTVEYGENFTSRLYAVNYGDWDVDGLELTYVFPMGVKPLINEDGTIDFTVRSYNGTYTNHHNTTVMTAVDSWDLLDNTGVSFEILQKPGDSILTTPSSSLVDVIRNSDGEQRYDEDGNEGSWVIKITVDKTLSKWWNRGEENGYIMALDIPSTVYEDTVSGYWYDRLYVAPIDKAENSYYQVYDTEYQGDKTYYHISGERFDLDMGGMNDYFSCPSYYGKDTYRPVSLVAPPMIYVNGYNVQTMRVNSTDDSEVLDQSNTIITGLDSEREYAKAGNVAAVRKPFIRLWGDLGERDENGVLDLKNLYVDMETEAYSVNINLENRYYAAEYPTARGNSSAINYSYNLEDGGARGTMFDPVFTAVLPYGSVPLNKDGKMFSENFDGTPVNGINNSTDAVMWDISLSQWNPAENTTMGNDQLIHALGDEELQNQNLTKDNFKVQVDFDETTKQYILKFIPSETLDPSQVKAIKNQQMLKISVQAVSYDYVENAPDYGQESSKSNMVQVYVGSNHDTFRFCSDNNLATEEKTAGNPYQVLSKRISNKKENGIVDSRKFGIDPRLDSVRYVSEDRTWVRAGAKGTYVGDYLGKTEVIDSADHDYKFPTKQQIYLETELSKDESIIQGLKAESNGVTFADLNWDGGYEFTDNENAVVEDTGLSNTFVILPKSAQLISKISTALSPDEEGLVDGDQTSPLDYADDMWYYLEVKNEFPTDRDIGIFDADEELLRPDPSKTGRVNHATYTLTTYLPEGLRYDDTYADSADDKYAEYMIEMYNEEGILTGSYTMEELEANGWKVEVKSFPVDSSDPNGAQFVRALVVPAGQATEDIYLPDNRPAGQLKYGESFVLKIKTRVAEYDYLEDQNTYKEPDGAELYVNVHGTDGGEISIADLSQINDGKFVEQSLNHIDYYNRLIEEPIRVDDTNDYDQDGVTGGEDPERYSYDKSGSYSVTIPRSTVRTNTIRIRRVMSPEPITGEIPSRDAVYKLAETQEMVINQAVLDTGAVNRFVLEVDLPYRSTISPITGVAQYPDPLIDVYFKEASTGVWEVPADAENKEELEENLRVYLYVRYTDGTESYTDIEESPIDVTDSKWVLINPEGNGIKENKLLSVPNAVDVCQAVWVVQHKDDPEHYPVPTGFRLDVDADDATLEKEEINEVDPLQPNTGEGLHGEEFSDGILQNAIKYNLETTLNENKQYAQYLNVFAEGWSKYSDSKNHAQSDAYRAGYQVTPELPYMDLYSDTKYLQWNKTGGNFIWDDSLLLDLSTSRILKHRFELFNVNQEIIDQYDRYGGSEDTLTNPTIAVALPYRETITASNFDYVPYDEIAGTALDESYTTTNSSDIPKIQADLKWTAYVVDEDGTKYPLSESEVIDPQETVQVSWDGEVLYSKKPVDMGADRNILTFNFIGRLNPGQKVVVEYLAAVGDGLITNDPADMQTKGYGLKEGNFLAARLPVESEDDDGGVESVPSKVGVRSDSHDVNSNKNTNELALELASETIGIASNPILERRKRASSDLDSTNNETGLPIAVQEGGYYRFTSSVQNLNTAGSPDYMAPVLFDVLPYKGDEIITGSLNSEGEFVANSRNSQWNGWLVPESIELYCNGVVEDNASELVYYKVDRSLYDIYVGPIVKQDGEYVLLTDSEGQPIIPDLNDRSESDFYIDINTGAPGSALETDFVKLDELLQSNPANYEELIKGIRTLLIVFKDPANTVLYGSGSYEIQYNMQAPLNLPIFPGNIADNPTGMDYNEFVGWNTMASATTGYNSTGKLDGNYIIADSNPAGVLLNAPADRGYIGDYVWYDENANGLQDEAEYNRIINGSRNILSALTKDFDGDGELDDPGINGAKVELLTEKGYPSNVDGQAVVANPDTTQGGYFVIDEETGEYLTVDGVKVWTNKGPVSTVTTKDYYGNSGYYILSNLAPGNYKLRFTMPEEYNGYALTTPEIYGKGIEVYQEGDSLPALNTQFEVAGNGTKVTNITFVTDAIAVEAVDLTDTAAFIEYDKNAVKADIGVALPVSYGGTVWDDADASVNESFHYNGILDSAEQNSGIPNIEVVAYEKGSDTVAIGTDGKPLSVITDENGNYVFDTLWPHREYEFRIPDTSVDGVPYKSTPVYTTSDPLEKDQDNDGVSEWTGYTNTVYVAAFKAEYPRNESGQIIKDEQGKWVAANTSIDMGLVNPETGAIGNYVWIDANKNGIQDEGESPYGGLELVLEPWYYDDDNLGWNRVPDGVIDAELLSTVSADNGFYSFTKLPSIFRYYYDANGNETTGPDDPNTTGSKTFIVGYRIRVPSLPDGYSYTVPNAGTDDEKDSDLISDGYLTRPGEYIVIAEEDTAEVPNEDSLQTVMRIDGEEIVRYYIVGTTEFRMEFDVGIAEIGECLVSGRVWEDVDADGIQDPESERAIEGVTVYLEKLIGDNTYADFDPADKVDVWQASGSIYVNENGYLVTDRTAPETGYNKHIEPEIVSDGQYEVVAQTVTDDNGEYSFRNLEAYDKTTGEPFRYRVRIEKPINSQLTVMNAENDSKDSYDSDFGLIDAENQPEYAVTESFVLGRRLFEDTEQTDGFGNQYAFALDNERNHVDAGLLVYSNLAVIGDYVWNDRDEDGIQDENESGIKGREVVLYRFDPDALSKVYILDENNNAIGTQTVKGKWVICTDSAGNPMKTVTDANGKYQFIVEAYDSDPNSENYLKPYHYRAVVYYNGEGEWSPLMAGTDENLDSNGYVTENVLDITVPESADQELNGDDVVFDQNGVSPFDTPVGDIFGMPIGGNTAVSGEFRIVNVYTLTGEFADADQLYSAVYDKMFADEETFAASEAQTVPVEGSAEMFEDEDQTTEEGGSDTPEENEEDTGSLEEGVLNTLNENIETPDNTTDAVTAEYVNIRQVKSDLSMDFGIVLTDEESENPTDPDDPNNPNNPNNPDDPNNPNNPDGGDNNGGDGGNGENDGGNGDGSIFDTGDMFGGVVKVLFVVAFISLSVMAWSLYMGKKRKNKDEESE